LAPERARRRGVTRRTAVAGAAAGAAGAALPRRASAAARRTARRKADVVVVGAGFAGLSAAHDLVRAGRSVVVLEARKRVGGRTLNASLGGGKVIEVGGQWVGPTQDRILALCKATGVATYKTYNSGQNLYYRNGSASRFDSTGPLGPIPPDAEGAPQAGAAIAMWNDMASRVPREAPWEAAQAVEWDSQTVETFVAGNAPGPSGRFLLDVGVEAVFAAEPRDISLLWLLFYTAAAGNEDTPGDFNRLINTADGAQDSRCVGGTQLVAQRVARQLGRRVVLDSPVRRIAQSSRGVTVESDRVAVSAKRVVVAIPPTLCRRIRWQPELPALRDRLTQNWPMGSVVKCEAVYDRPFWRDDGLTGQVVSDSTPVRITFDNTPPDGSPGVMLGFIEGQAARVWGPKSPAERRAAVLRNFATYFGDRALSPTRYIEHVWQDELWSGGCYGGNLTPGALLDYGPAIREPVGRIHWAGTETSTLWAGYIDGAVRSGERAAAEVLARL
jgi:monoamine oxidase